MQKLLTLLRQNVLAFAALLVLLGGATYAVAAKAPAGKTSPPPTKRIYACATERFGTLNLTSAARACPAGQTKISWDVVGGAGKRGATGPKGAKGEPGTAGAKGDAGAPGAKGDAGSPGTKGDQGAAGTTGESGAAGAKGDAGAAGPAGPQGPIGPIGPAGPIGPTGPKGETGADGGSSWARSKASVENGIAIPILTINTPLVLGFYTVTTPKTQSYLASWKVTVQPPLALVSLTCGLYADNVLVPGSQTAITISQSVLAPVPVQGTALAADLPAGTQLAPGCASSLLGSVVTAARLVVSSVDDGAVSVS
jgi:hypothetical protein